jgi:hypothetical protein
MFETLHESTVKYLERNHNRSSRYGRENQKATICYLTLPSRTAKWKTHLEDLFGGSDYFSGDSARSMLVDPSSLVLTEEQQRRFIRGMLHLALRPSVHPSQLKQDLSANSTISNSLPSKKASQSAPSEDAPKEESVRGDAVIKKRIKDLEQSKWPKLMLLSSHTIEGPP